jgi:ubiquinone/menaquinone biosynthesis C-methylase UbiE
VSFQKASAASLPFEDGSFDVVVSNLVFHEVKAVADKTLPIKEALRVLRKGGCFVFQDLFQLKSIYGATDDLLRTIRGWGVARFEFVHTSRSSFIPATLRLPFMVGALGIIHGVK